MSKSTAIIIGAGPAGCVAAILLARGGWRVTLIEQHRFPRDKVCGECLSALGYAVLERIGVREAFARLDPVALSHCMIYAPAGTSLRVDLPQPMWGISRKRLDAFLLDAARDAGATILQPARCEGLNGVARVRDLDTNATHELRADWTLLADGKGALMPRRGAPTGDLGLKAHFTDVAGPRDAIELFGVDGHYGGVAAIEDGRWNVAFSVPQARIAQHRGDFDRLFDQIADENLALRERFATARRVSDWIASPLPRFAVSSRWPQRTIPLGNAAAAVEPIGGEGMGLAMRGAELAAEMLLAGKSGIASLRRQFDSLWRLRSAGCRLSALAVSTPSLARWIHRTRPLSRVVLMSLGKLPSRG